MTSNHENAILLNHTSLTSTIPPNLTNNQIPIYSEVREINSTKAEQAIATIKIKSRPIFQCGKSRPYPQSPIEKSRVKMPLHIPPKQLRKMIFLHILSKIKEIAPSIWQFQLFRQYNMPNIS